jgi:hypothetical protein
MQYRGLFMRLKIDLDEELSEALVQAADRELRYPHQQAEAFLRQALGLPSPIPEKAIPTEEPASSSKEWVNAR